MSYQAANRYPHACTDPSRCELCQHEDASERAAIQTEGQGLSVYQRAVELLRQQRRPGQRALLAG